MLTSIDREGTYLGFDLQLIEQVSNFVEVPLIVCGGAKTLLDIKKAVDMGASAVAAGSMFVFKQPLQAVLISYPRQSEIKKLLN